VAHTISDAAITAVLRRQMTRAVGRGNLANLNRPGYRAKDVLSAMTDKLRVANDQIRRVSRAAATSDIDNAILRLRGDRSPGSSDPT
jgi:flagellar basal body rod protein FlgB